MYHIFAQNFTLIIIIPKEPAWTRCTASVVPVTLDSVEYYAKLMWTTAVKLPAEMVKYSQLHFTLVMHSFKI